MTDALTAITCTEARHAGEAAQKQDLPDREVMLATFRGARNGFMAPDDNVAFLAGVGALLELFPEKKDAIMAEARAIGDRSKILTALVNGVPVDFDRVDPSPMPDEPLGLVELFKESEL